MKIFKISLGAAGGAAILAVCLVAISTMAGFAQTDAFVGTWRLNVAKSKYSPGPPPKSQTVTYQAAGQGIKVAATGTDADGKPVAIQYTANYDGKDYTVTGNPDWDATALKRINAYTVEFTRKKAGKFVQTGTNVVSKDGRTRTISSKGFDAKGQKIDNIAVYEKQ